MSWRVSLLFAASLTWAGGACHDDTVPSTLTLQAADTADQVLEGMEHLVTEDGVRRSRVKADTALLFESTELARLHHLTVTFFDAGGSETSTIIADSGLYQMRDGSMNAWGHVLATTPDGRKLRSEELKYDSRSKKISSDRAFVYDRGSEHLEGDGFTSDPDFKNVTARRPHGRQGADSGGFLLPGQ